MLRRPDVQAAIAERQKEAFKAAGLAPERVLLELARIAFANIEDVTRLDAHGQPYLDLSELDRAQWAGIGEITVDEYTDGRGEDARQVKRIKIKLLDRQRALETLGKHYGLVKEPEVKVEVSLVELLKAANATEAADG